MTDGNGNEGLRRTIVHRALNRPNLVLGGERTLTLLTTLISAALVVAAQNLVALVVGASLYTVAMAALTKMAKADPQMSRVYLRHIGYARFYSARTSIWTR